MNMQISCGCLKWNLFIIALYACKLELLPRILEALEISKEAVQQNFNKQQTCSNCRKNVC